MEPLNIRFRLLFTRIIFALSSSHTDSLSHACEGKTMRLVLGLQITSHVPTALRHRAREPIDNNRHAEGSYSSRLLFHRNHHHHRYIHSPRIDPRMSDLTREPAAELEVPEGPPNGPLERCKPLARRPGLPRKSVVSEYSMWNVIKRMDVIAVNVSEGGASGFLVFE